MRRLPLKSETYYCSCVIPDLLYITTHDREFSNELDVSESTRMCKRSDYYLHLIDVRADGVSHDRLGHPGEDKNRNLEYGKGCLFTRRIATLDTE